MLRSQMWAAPATALFYIALGSASLARPSSRCFCCSCSFSSSCPLGRPPSFGRLFIPWRFPLLERFFLWHHLLLGCLFCVWFVMVNMLAVRVMLPGLSIFLPAVEHVLNGELPSASEIKHLDDEVEMRSGSTDVILSFIVGSE